MNLAWFYKLTGFEETHRDAVYQQLSLHNGRLRSAANQREYLPGNLSLSSCAELTQQAFDYLSRYPTRRSQVSEVVADVQDLHLDLTNQGAVFQVASQFNLLEMPSPHVTPDDGVSNYEYDRTQGPACAIACGAGLIYRNYFVEVDGEIGQLASRQLDASSALKNELSKRLQLPTSNITEPWLVKNGYLFATPAQLQAINDLLAKMHSAELETLTGLLKVGVHADTQVTLNNASHTVTQIYCSALPIGYSAIAAEHWEPLARLVLRAAYQSTLAAAVINREHTGNNTVYLTLLGGGVFANPVVWIIDALAHALNMFQQAGLSIKIVSRDYPHPAVQSLLRE